MGSDDSAVLVALVDHSQEQLAYLDREFRFVRVNPAYCAGCGRRAEELLGRRHFDVFPNPENQAIFEAVRDSAKPAVHREKPFVFPDEPGRGVTYWDWTLSPVTDSAGRVDGLVLSLHEVTDQVLARQRLEESEERFRLMADGTPIIIWVTRPDGGLQFANRGYRDYFAVGQEQVEGDRWQPLVHPADAEAYVAATLEAARRRAPFASEARVRRADGEWRWIASHAEPRFSAAGEYLGHVGISTDITEIKRTEAALREADRNKDEFLAALSHELRNPLAPITNALSVLDEAAPGSDPARRALQIVRRQVTQLSRLVDDLLDLTRVARGKMVVEPTPVDLNELVLKTTDDYQSLFQNAGVRLEVSAAPEPLHVEVDAQRITQVVGNLLTNAAKFAGRGGRTDVVLRPRGPGFALLRVTDDGIGIEPEMLPHVFERFAQASGDSGRSRTGLGLGLALAKGIVELHGGEIRASSAGPGMGAAFEVSLPRMLAQAGP